MYDKNGDGRFEILSWNISEDFDNDKEADWMEIVKAFKEIGYVWGGDWKFKDYPHFEKTFGLGWRDLLQKHNNKDFIPGTNYVRI